MASDRRAVLLLLACSAHRCAGQFGNLNVQWSVEDAATGASKPVVQDDRITDMKPKPDARLRNLARLDVEALEEIVSSFGESCTACTTHGHWASKVRASTLEASNKMIKTQAR